MEHSYVVGGGGISDYGALSKGGTVRFDKPSATRSGVSPVEYR